MPAECGPPLLSAPSLVSIFLQWHRNHPLDWHRPPPPTPYTFNSWHPRGSPNPGRAGHTLGRRTGDAAFWLDHPCCYLLGDSSLNGGRNWVYQKGLQDPGGKVGIPDSSRVHHRPECHLASSRQQPAPGHTSGSVVSQTFSACLSCGFTSVLFSLPSLIFPPSLWSSWVLCLKLLQPQVPYQQQR